ncbi:MAG TPA: DUF1501 domain-containing protein [Bauldia sp.]|nr:DUF1501 domain-containing protein [Bauldia sp.]
MPLASDCFESLTRRSFLQASAVLSFAALPELAFGAEAGDTRLLVILLRGGIDGLTAMPPIGDPGLKGKRKHLLPDGLLKLDGFFALHPAFQQIHDAYQSNQALLVHGISFPYTGRSHFEGQDIMETGVLNPFSSRTGWLGRALDVSGQRSIGMALPVPLILRGKNPADSQYPTWISNPPDSIYQKLAPLWAADPDTAPYSAQLATKVAAGLGEDATMDIGITVDLRVLALQAARKLAKPDGPRVAVIDDVGFDTHAQETELLVPKMQEVDQAIGIFRNGVGEDVWKKTLVVTVTEFGRTAAENGSFGTDHGWGSCAFVVGGALKKGGIVADWPGLTLANLYEGRDLKATIDARSLYAAIVTAALGVDPDLVQKDVLEHPKDDRFAPFLA